jgi:hypothetical protein
MRIPSPASSIIGTAAALVVLAGCSGGSSPIAPFAPGGRAGNTVTLRSAAAGSRHTVTTTSFMRSDAVHKPLIFVSDQLNTVVNIYLQAGKNQQVGQITGLSFPGGLATDAAGNLYVPNQFSVTNPAEVSRILVYAPPYTKARRVLSDSDYFPVDVAVSPQGVVAAANIANTSFALGTGSVTFFAKNATQPCATIAVSGYQVDSVGFDANGNLYVRAFSFYNHTAFISEITGGCQATTITPLTTTNTIEAPETNGIKVDKAGRIAIMTTAGPNYDNIDTYNPPVSGSLGGPVSITPITTAPFPQNFAFLASGKYFYTAEVLFGQGYAREYHYSVGPASGVPINTIYVGAAATYGVAVSPPVIP